MPLIQVDLHQGTTTPEQRGKISDALHDAMREVLGIPADDRFHTFTEYPEGSLFHDDVVFGIPRDRNTMFITFSFNNRAADEKNRLYAAVIDNLKRTAGVAADHVLIRVIETASENWWATGRTVNPDTGYDQRMSAADTGAKEA